MNRIIILDYVSGKSVWEHYQLYKKTQWYSKEEMEKFQVSKLKKLLYHCYYNVPYYRAIIEERKIDIFNFNSPQILSQFPLLTKEIIQSNYKAFIPLNITKIKGVKTGQTGGTTGNILFNKNDSNTRSSTWGSFMRFTNDWMGVKENDKKLILMGGHVMGSEFKDRIKKGIINILSNQISFSPYDTSEKNIENIIDALNNNNFIQIRSYSQFLFLFALKLKERNLTYNVKAITTTAEPLMLEHRKLFKEVFNSEVFDQYGLGEIGGVAYECNHHKGLHITDERVIVEINDNNDIIVTDLDNYAMPYINYWNADQAILSTELCSCGRKSKLIKQIMGRTCDYIQGINGQTLHWAYFWHLFFDSMIAEKRKLKKFQVVQETKELLKIRLICDELSLDEKKSLVHNIQSRLGAINIQFVFENNIENSPSGKYRPVINKLI